MPIVSSFKELRLKFPGTKDLLFKDLSISFEKGEKVLMLGPSGCGKSTLLQALSGLIPNSVDVPIKFESCIHPESWGFVFQDPDTQFCMPYADEEIAFVLENLNVPREQMPKRIDELLSIVGLDLKDHHSRINTFSGGMKQRLAIASVLALDPEVLFFDEPTAMLDPEGTKMIWETVKNISTDKTVIIVEHKIEHVIDFIDRIIVFDAAGTIIADGRPESVFVSCRNEFLENGIWFPGIWDQYRAPSSVSKKPDFQLKKKVLLENFIGFRHKETKIKIKHAEARPGDWIAVVGKNGAGKSTLLLSLIQLLKTSGTYQINGKNILGNKDISREAGFVFQNPELQFVANTVFDELAFTLRQTHDEQETIEKKVTELLMLFNLSGQKSLHPYQLSMGQKRRLSVATAVAQNPAILLLDEPTFGQDSKNTFALLELLESYRKSGHIIIMATHDKQIIEYFATKVWEVIDGEVMVNNKKIEEEMAISAEVSHAYSI
ncbi:energy-coupling factor ABC transporter ATP-binding protein [Mesobacillus subterraneus]|uniref:ABC transporter ATP-binding protein n=1 Tax=Mesobacillus subterraneus TaxID=285983 RepID=UPI00203FEC31|nr:ABC transporter ATP-binding protein [Mesobacillus subterraneus]MCM3574850.1 energy-coupling factor ABC transporter ATP-binding protein [Mesobacillus subterraneus]